MTMSLIVDVIDTIVCVIKLIGALLISIVYGIEELLRGLVPRAWRRRSIAGDVALVTGGGSGIGRLVCLKLAARGARIVTWDVNSEGNLETVRQVQAAGGECVAYTVDLCDRAAVYSAAQAVNRDVGKVDILVNNAGIVTGKNFMESPDSLIVKTFDVNIMSHFWTVKAFLPAMQEANKGHIVTVASLAGLAGVNKLADYCASKFAAVGFDESLRLELMVNGYTGIGTTCVCPYYISTGMFDGVKSKLIPILTPEYVASELVDGILLKKVHIILPGFCKHMVMMKFLLPWKGLYKIGKITGVTSTMDEFKGRQKKD